jgi:hypothetical protein
VPRVSSFELPISASHNHLLRVLPVVGCRSKTPTSGGGGETRRVRKGGVGGGGGGWGRRDGGVAAGRGGGRDGGGGARGGRRWERRWIVNGSYELYSSHYYPHFGREIWSPLKPEMFRRPLKFVNHENIFCLKQIKGKALTNTRTAYNIGLRVHIAANRSCGPMYKKWEGGPSVVHPEEVSKSARPSRGLALPVHAIELFFFTRVHAIQLVLT